MKDPFINFMKKKDVEEVKNFLNKQEKFYPCDLQLFLKCTENYVYSCFRYIRKKEKITTHYICRDILQKYMLIK